jgi:hypothetical protein
MSDEAPVTPTQTTESSAPVTPVTPVVEAAPVVEPQTPATPEPVGTPAPSATVPEAAVAAPVERVVPAADEYTAPEFIPQQLKEFANSNGFTQDQFDKTISQFGGMMQTNAAAEKTAVRAQGDALLTTWGAEKDTNLSLVRRALAQTDPTGEVTKLLNSTGFGNHPTVLNYLLEQGKALQEGGFLKSNTNTTVNKASDRAHRMYPNDVPANTRS